LAKLRENMETRRFFRSLAEARRRYSGPAGHATAVLGHKPNTPRRADDEDAPTTDHEGRPAAEPRG